MGEAVTGEITSGISGVSRKIFLEYLNLPFWFKLQFARKITKVAKEYSSDAFNVLWRDLLGPYYKGYEPGAKSSSIKVGQILTLREIQLTSFVPRSPGKFYSEGYDVRRGLRAYLRVDEPVPRDFVIDVHKACQIAMSALGTDCVPPGATPLIGAGVPIWSMKWRDKQRVFSAMIDARNGRVIDVYDSSKLDHNFLSVLREDDRFFRGGWSGVVRFREHHGRRLAAAFPPRDRAPSDYYAVDLGLPVVLTSQAFAKIQDTVEHYGCAHLESITGVIEEIPEEVLRERLGSPILEWGAGIPKVGLVINSRLLLKHPGTPTEGWASAWTAVKHRQVPYFLRRGFSIGTADYEERIKDSVDEIGLRLKTIGAVPMFDFDERTPRFSAAKYGPNYFLRRSGILKST